MGACHGVGEHAFAMGGHKKVLLPLVRKAVATLIAEIDAVGASDKLNISVYIDFTQNKSTQKTALRYLNRRVNWLTSLV